MSSKFIITEHAVEQFITRYDRTLSYHEGKLLLETAINDETVNLLHERTLSGEEQWHIPSLGVVLITKPRREGNVIVTVITESHIPSIHRQKCHEEQFQEYETLTTEKPEEIDAIPDATGKVKHERIKFIVEVAYKAGFPNREYAVALIRGKIQDLLNRTINFRNGQSKVTKIDEYKEPV